MTEEKASRTSAPPSVVVAMHARLIAARAAGIPLARVHEKAGVAESVVFMIASGKRRGMTDETARRLTVALDELGAPAARVPPPAKPIAHAAMVTSITKAEAEALRPLVQKAFDDAPPVNGRRQYKPVLERLGLTSGTYHQFLQLGLGMRHDTAARVWRGLGLDRPAEFAATAPAVMPKWKPRSSTKAAPPLPARRGGATSPRLPEDLIREIKAFTRNAVMVQKVCTLDEFLRATLYTRQGIFTLWSADANRPVSPERAREMLRYLAKRGARGAKALLRRIEATGTIRTELVHVSVAVAPGVAPGQGPRARSAIVLSTRDRLRDALPHFGSLPKLAKHIGLTAAKTGKILKGSTMTQEIATQIADRLATIPPRPAQMTLALGGLVPREPPSADLDAVDPGELGAAAQKLVAKWGREALDMILALTKRP